MAPKSSRDLSLIAAVSRSGTHELATVWNIFSGITVRLLSCCTSCEIAKLATISPNLKFKSEILGGGRIFYCKEFRVGGGTVPCVYRQSLWAVSRLGHKDCKGSREHCWVGENHLGGGLLGH